MEKLGKSGKIINFARRTIINYNITNLLIMKKSIAILSMALLACNAYAADKLVPGTVEAPNYYVITANRGLPFVTYTAEKMTDGKAETTLYRSDKLSKEAVWAVVAGQVEGTVNIYNYTTGNGADKEYMFAFNNKNEDAEFVGDSDSGTATTTSEAADVYVKDNDNGSYGLALKSEIGSADGGYWGLDATSGETTKFLGNWLSYNDGGTRWWFYKVDVDKDIDAELEAIQTEAYREKMTPMVEEYTGKFQSYIDAVPYVEKELNEGIDALNQLEVTANYAAKITDIWNECMSKANATLNTMFADKLYALKNLRRAAQNLNSFVAVNMTSDNYMPVALMADFNAQFTLKSVENGGYQFYNDETKTYIGRKESETETEGEDGKKETVTTQWFGPVEDAASAVTVYPVLNTNDGYYGISFPFAESKTGDGFNANSWADPDGGDLVEWGINDGGSIWQLVEVDVESILNDAVNRVKTALEPYIPNVPEEVAAVLKKAIQGTEYLEYNSSLASNASALVNNAIAAGNDILKKDLGGKKWELKSLRNGYIEVAKGDEKVTKVSNTRSDASTYSFVNDNEGGYRIYSPVAELYFGPIVDGDGGTDVTLVAAEADAIKVYPVLNSHSGYYGVSFPTTDGGTYGINANASGLHGYTINDGGSIFSIAFVNVSTGIVEVEKAETVREGIYDLSGRKLSAPVRGINIINGHKVLVK